MDFEEEEMDALLDSIRKLRDASARQLEGIRVLGKATEDLLATALRHDQKSPDWSGERNP
jgi:hypothetical protein